MSSIDEYKGEDFEDNSSTLSEKIIIEDRLLSLVLKHQNNMKLVRTWFL